MRTLILSRCFPFTPTGLYQSPQYILHANTDEGKLCTLIMDIVRLEGHDDPLYAGGVAEMVGARITSFQEHC